jgi:hypothetical protein
MFPIVLRAFNKRTGEMVWEKEFAAEKISHWGSRSISSLPSEAAFARN